MNRRPLLVLIVTLAFLAPVTSVFAQNLLLRIGSKPFTESVILAEIVKCLASQNGQQARHLGELGGSRILWNALTTGQIDAYPEYIGTLTSELLAGEDVSSEVALHQTLAKHGVAIVARFGFSNTYALGVKEEVANRLGLRTISDLNKRPNLRLGFSNEFLERQDGWPGLRQRYGLAHQPPVGLEHSLALRGLAASDIDVTDLYSTDAEIQQYHLRVLEDDKRYFPAYDAVLLCRLDLQQRAPGLFKALGRLSGTLSADEMVTMNSKVQLGGMSEARVAADFIKQTLGAATESCVAESESWWDRRLRLFWNNTLEHLFLVLVSLTAAVLIAVPLGVAAYKFPSLGQVILGVVGVIQTLPSLALLVFMIPLLGLGPWPAIVALFLYSLLPIVRNTCNGLQEIPNSLQESALVLGLPPRARLWRIELPIASRAILAGVKIAAVINVGTATIGALIGAGGYGEPILTGIRLNDVGLILQGAVPAAVLALLVQGLFGLAERWLVPRGLLLTGK